MQTLPNNCRAGNFSVYPPNWRTVRADIKKQWRISYYFYDDNLKKKRKIVLKSGINRLHTLKERQEGIQALIRDELDELQRKGWNYITKTYTITDQNDITSFTLFVDALNFAFKSLTVDTHTLADIKSCLKYVTLAIRSLRYDTLTIGAVRLKHFILIFEESARTNKKWSASRHNHYRTYLFILFKKLVLLGVVEANYLRDMPIEKQVKRIRETLSKEERILVNDHLYKNHYEFWRFMQIFFHSGARTAELLKVQAKDVNLETQYYKVIIKKGGQLIETLKLIKDIALPYWQEILLSANMNDYVFSKGLKPGAKKIRVEQIPRRWQRLVQKKLGITSTWYALKHLHTDEVAELLSLQEAADHNSHKSVMVTEKYYAVNEKKRKDDRVKVLQNKF